MELSSLNDAFLDVLVESGTRQEVQFRRIQHVALLAQRLHRPL